MGSFEEAVCQIYDDSGLEDALEKSEAADVLGAEAVERLDELSRLLDTVDPNRVPVEDLIGSPQMVEVRRLAAAALNALPG